MVLAEQGDRARIERIIAVLRSADTAARTTLTHQLVGTPACEGGCGWTTGGDTDAVARSNARTWAKFVAHFEAKLASVRSYGV